MEPNLHSEAHRSTDSRDSPPKDDVPNKGRNLLLSGLVAFSAMFGYAIAAGLVQVLDLIHFTYIIKHIV